MCAEQLRVLMMSMLVIWMVVYPQFGTHQELGEVYNVAAIAFHERRVCAFDFYKAPYSVSF